VTESKDIGRILFSETKTGFRLPSTFCTFYYVKTKPVFETILRHGFVAKPSPWLLVYVWYCADELRLKNHKKITYIKILYTVQYGFEDIVTSK